MEATRRTRGKQGTLRFSGPVSASPCGEGLDDTDAVRCTAAYSLAGWPAVVVRAGTSSEGLPINVQLVSQPWCEDVALAATKRVEEALGGWSKPHEL